MQGHQLMQYASTMIREGAVVLDVRSREEFRAGHLANACHINTPLFGDKDTTTIQPNQSLRLCRKLQAHVAAVYPPHICVLVYCSDGKQRSAAAKSLLETMGYSNVVIIGGFASGALRDAVDAAAKKRNSTKKYAGITVCYCCSALK